jgi:LysR family transcriptional regulator for metE and metH
MPSLDSDLLRPIALELRHLRLVIAVHDLGGLTRAGDRLNLTQSALSHQLREIEDRLGVQLFLRVGRKLVPTEAAAKLARAGRGILTSVLDAEDELIDRAKGTRGTLRITTECYTCYYWLPPLLKRFEALYPHVRVEIVPEATGRATEALLDGTVDLALTTVPVREDARTTPLFDDELMLVTSADHRLARRPFITPADLVNERLILYTPPEASAFYKQFFGDSGVAPREVVEVHLTQATVAMIAAGMGVAPMAVWAIGEELRRDRIKTVRIGEHGMQRRWHALTRNGRRIPQSIDAFIDLLRFEAVPGHQSRR